MGTTLAASEVSTEQVLLGDEAVALGAVHAGVSAAYAYPGTPSTEILEFLLRHRAKEGRPAASWCANEKTAYEQALGVSILGRRSLVSMKHVGLNVAADPFINSAIVAIQGGLVVAVADDPGMHSSQNEQDSRFYAEFARTICLEPADQQQAYDMTREAFDLSERFHVPVVVRLTTRLAHSRAVVRVRGGLPEKPLRKASDPSAWTLLPVNARRQWRALLDRQKDMRAWTEDCAHNTLTCGERESRLGVITTGIARNYFLENLRDLDVQPHHLHLGAYPIPAGMVRELAERVTTLLVIEEGYPYVERGLQGILRQRRDILGRSTGHVPEDGELNPDVARRALGLPPQAGEHLKGLTLPARPPQLCQGCPHRDTFSALKQALAGFERSLVTSDIGCYTLGALPPYCAIESCVCMGASIGMAKGAAEAGCCPSVAVIGDSTFLHSGVTPLMDAVAADSDITVLILDNETVAMTGTQPTILPSARLEPLVLGLGVSPEHLKVLEARPARVPAMAETIRDELDHHGLSVIISRRECPESARKHKTRAR